VVLTECGRVYYWAWGSVPNVLTFGGFDISGVVLMYSSQGGLLCVQDDCRLLWIQEECNMREAKHYGPISGVRRVASTARAHAVIATDGSVLVFGEDRYGGDPFGLDHVRGDDRLKLASDLRGGFEDERPWLIWGTDGSFVGTLTENDEDRGTDYSLEPSDHSLYGAEVCGSMCAFALLTPEGSVRTWGDAEAFHSRALAAQLSSAVVSVVSNQGAFAAIKEDGSVVTWGEATLGGDSSNVAALLSSGVVSILASDYAFVAIKEDCSVVSWGDAESGGDSSAVAAFLKEGVRQVFVAGGHSSSDAVTIVR
jgi:hypothetical protein